MEKFEEAMCSETRGTVLKFSVVIVHGLMAMMTSSGGPDGKMKIVHNGINQFLSGFTVSRTNGLR